MVFLWCVDGTGFLGGRPLVEEVPDLLECLGLILARLR
jgi:hypothetical protein